MKIPDPLVIELSNLHCQSRVVLAALKRGDSVTITHDGKIRGILRPLGSQESLTTHPAFGMWRNRRDLTDVDAVVRRWRRSRSC